MIADRLGLSARRIATTACPAVVALVSGCTTGPGSKTPVVEAFHPDGGGGPDAAMIERLGDARDLVLALSPGDVLEIELSFAGDLVEGSGTIPLVLRRPILLHASEHGIAASLDDGTSWHPLDDLVGGSLDIGLGLSGRDRRNVAPVRVRTRID